MTETHSVKELLAQAREVFKEKYGHTPTAFGVAPGRIEILGNHTDYNGGRVMAAAIDRYIIVVGHPAEGKSSRIYSIDLAETDVFDHTGELPEKLESFSKYSHGVLAVLSEIGLEIGPMDMVIASNIPVGAGLSSSAALEAATAMLAKVFFPYELDSMNLALLLQRAENVYAGIPCGLLDQFSTLHGVPNGLLFLNCLNYTFTMKTMPKPAPAFVICDSRAPHDLAVSPYPVRREECERVANYLGDRLGKSGTPLCAFTAQEYLTYKDKLNDPYPRRADHVFGEHLRVAKAEKALEEGKIEVLGDLMRKSHRSSMENFENSTPELNEIWELAAKQPGWLGGRLSGGGWGGCTVNLIEADKVDEFVDGMRNATVKIRDVSDHIYVCHASGGAKGGRL